MVRKITKEFSMEKTCLTFIHNFSGTIVDDSTYLLAKNDIQGRGCIVGIGGLESCFVQQYSPGPLSHSHPDIPALSVALQYFTQLEV